MISRRTALAVGLSLVPTALTRRRALAAPAGPAASGRIRLPSGRQLGYALYGDPAGRLVLYFHGTPGSRIEATLISEEATAAGIHLVAVERPGIGLSTFQPCRRILDWPEDVAHLVEALGYGGAAFGVVGLSGGAPYALACLRAMPDRITHAAIVSGQAPRDSGTSGNQTRTLQLLNTRPRISTAVVNGIARQLHRRPDKTARRIAENWAESDRRLVLCDPKYYAAYLALLRQAIHCGTAGVIHDAQLLGQCWGFRLSELPPSPVSIWQGGCDPVAPPSMGRWFHRQLAGSELVIDPHAGHITMAKWHATAIFARFP